MAKRHPNRELSMAGAFTPICLCEKSNTGRPICTTYRTRPAGAHQGKSNRSVTRARKSCLKAVRTMGTNPGCPCGVHHHPTALWTPFVCPLRGSSSFVENL